MFSVPGLGTAKLAAGTVGIATAENYLHSAAKGEVSAEALGKALADGTIEGITAGLVDVAAKKVLGTHVHTEAESRIEITDSSVAIFYESADNPELKSISKQCKSMTLDKIVSGEVECEFCEWPSAKGLIGHDFEAYLHKIVGGESKYIKGSNAGRDFDGVFGNRWYEAKSGRYWDKLLQNESVKSKFKRKMSEGLKIAQENGATYELFSNSPIPDSIKTWLTKKGIPFTEILE